MFPSPPPPHPTLIPLPRAESKEMWLKTSVAATFGIILPYFTFCMIKELSHEHHHGPVYPHMRIRRKAFPWKAGDCEFFAFKCKSDFAHGVTSSHH